MIRRLIQLPKTILSRYRTKQKTKKTLKSLKEIRKEQKKCHALFLKADRHANKEEAERLGSKLEVFDWLMKK